MTCAAAEPIITFSVAVMGSVSCRRASHSGYVPLSEVVGGQSSGVKSIYAGIVRDFLFEADKSCVAMGTGGTNSALGELSVEKKGLHNKSPLNHIKWDSRRVDTQMERLIIQHPVINKD